MIKFSKEQKLLSSESHLIIQNIKNIAVHIGKINNFPHVVVVPDIAVLFTSF